MVTLEEEKLTANTALWHGARFYTARPEKGPLHPSHVTSGNRPDTCAEKQAVSFFRFRVRGTNVTKHQLAQSENAFL